VVGRAVYEGGQNLREKLIGFSAKLLGGDGTNVICENGRFRNAQDDNAITLQQLMEQAAQEGLTFEVEGFFDPDTTRLDQETGQGIPYATYAFATQAALVKIDKETGELEVEKIIAAHDVGQAINPAAVEAQVQGGAVMGLGYAAMEKVVVDRGRILNPGFHEYLIPTAMDIPEITTIIVEDKEPTGPYGAKGVGEPALVPTAAAILNAVSRAISCRIKEIPVTAEKIWEAMQTRELE
jgi:CO/xanthine dehydrogenase Mo-binding subunit